MDLGTGIAVSSICVAIVSTFAVWRHTTVSDLRAELESTQKKAERVTERLSDCRSMNQWLLNELMQRSGFRPPPSFVRRIEETDDDDE